MKRKWRKKNPEKAKEINRKSSEKKTQKRREERTSLKFLQITQALSEIANINTENK
jgi:hypothetical protein